MKSLAQFGSLIGAVIAGVCSVIAVAFMLGGQGNQIAEVSRALLVMSGKQDALGADVAFIKGQLAGVPPTRLGSLP